MINVVGPVIHEWRSDSTVHIAMVKKNAGYWKGSSLVCQVIQLVGYSPGTHVRSQHIDIEDGIDNEV